MRVIGIDYGEKRIGIAASDPLGMTAQGISAVEDEDAVCRVIQEYGDVEEVVVGLPKTMRGEIGPQAQKVLEFIERLKDRLKLKIVPWDERLTTSQADKFLISAGVSRAGRKKVIDKSAAAIILQSYLDAH
ncbi:MAG: Holliday junction resolvase RuvX [Candidatus Margulisiibacteriota bacterium]